MALSVDIEKRFKGFTLRVAFEAGDETLALLGASGSGKSMTLRCIAGVEKPDRGRIVLDGETLFDSEKRIDLSPQQRRVGLMFQHYALFPQMTVKQNVRCGARRGLKGKEREQAVSEALASFGLSEFQNRLPAQLSGGQQQRVALARILVSQPHILMLDEPFSALDSHLRFRMEQEVRQVIRSYGKTVLLVSHNRDEVYRMADRVAVMNSGHLEAIGTKADVFSHPGTRAACVLTGCKNISAIRPIDAMHADALDWGISLALPLQPETDAVGIRMHSIEPGEGENAFRCKVTEVIENPFSITVMLHPVTAPTDAAPIGWEMEKAVWERLKADELTVHLPINSILQLKG
ncbi:MAG: sulfate/molybdate ABC transporter ATP-binding protein [Clostridia bacterium]|nr:sulfate/molybdate ABC transporter ATP-binding protein [Clostridia bacterium]